MSPSSDATALPSAAEIRSRIMRLESTVGFLAVGVVLLYLAVLVQPTAREWLAFCGVTGVYALVCGFALEPVRRRIQRPLRALSSRTGDSDGDAWRAAFGCLMQLPMITMRLSFGTWIAAGPFVCVGMWAAGHPEWLGGTRLFGVTSASLSGGLLSVSFGYFVIRRGVAPVCDRLAREIPDAAERRGLFEPVPLARKLQIVVAGAGIAALLVTVAVAYEGARGSLLDYARYEHTRTLADAVARVAEHEPVAPTLDHDGIERLLEGDEIERTPERAAAPATPGVDWYTPASLPTHRAVLAAAASGSRVLGDALVTWETTPDGRIAAVATPTAVLLAGLASLRLVLAGVFAISAAICLALARMVGEDVRRNVAQLHRGAERIARGDLTEGQQIVCDDELADLAVAFSSMSGGLRSTLERVAMAAGRFDAAVAQIQGVSRDVTTASSEQTRRVGEVGELVEAISRETEGVAGWAQALSDAVEESGSSTLELGATGDELLQTAGALSERVEEVSGSIEQMVRSVKQVAATTETLSEAASDTSSSMEEMASAMRAIDTTAARTAELASGVVASSESGLTKVQQTIDGMQSIRDATDDAERVIRGLGERTKEIGAILDVIDDVGDETTLLALNAAIIAAQAGEHGRAFSVVADEIKELADRVLSSTKEIGALIRSVQNEADNAVGAIEAGSQRVSEGVDLAAEAGVSLEEITTAAAESGRHIERIVEAVREQTGAAARVAELMDRVSGGVEEIRGAGADQDRANELVYRSAITMREIAQQVRRTTEEQSRGFRRIRDSVESVRETVEQIDGSVQQQSAACVQVRGFLEIVGGGARANEESVREMERSTVGLAREAEALREEVDRFEV